LIACKTGDNPFSIVHQLHDFAVENPYQFRYAIKFTPLERCVPSEIESIVKAAAEIIGKIQEKDTFRISIKKRHSNLEHMEVVTAVAEIIDRTVNLDNPDWTVWIEIVGEWTGVSILDKERDILSIMTMRDDMY
jgi:tRNA acetyltransferase TAN1